MRHLTRQPDARYRSRDKATVAPLKDWERSKHDRRLRRSAIAWREPWASPFVVELTCEGKILSVPVFDARPHAEREDTLPPEVEVDADTAQVMRDRLLFEQYGGRLADPDNSPIDYGGSAGNDATVDPEYSEGGDHGDSYAVPVFILARQHYTVVDNWAETAQKVVLASAHPDTRIVVIRDGERLAAGGVKVTEARRHAARPPSRERRSMPRERATRPTQQSVCACRLAS
jgi:hypothetical protein